jgi:hypothetical protein
MAKTTTRTPEQWADEMMMRSYAGGPEHLVQMIRRLIAEERRACAKVAAVENAAPPRNAFMRGWNAAARAIADKILARQEP